MLRALLLLLLATCASFADGPSEKEWAASLNVAGRQRMLGQKMAKEAFQIALGIDAVKSKEDLKASMALFEKSLQGLAKGDAEMGLPAPAAALAALVANEAKAWEALAKDLSGVLDATTDVAKVAEDDRRVVSEAQALVTALEAGYRAATGKAWGVVVDLAGKQRMFSQKMAKEIFQVKLKLDAETHRSSLKLSAETFDQTLKGLSNGDAKLGLPPTTDDAARAQLAQVGKVWAEFRPYVDRVLKKEDLSADDLARVAALNVQLLDEADKAVTIFLGLAGK